MYSDTYFLSPQAALNTALQQNRFGADQLQVCYYSGEKIETDLVNLIYLPFETFVDSLAQGIYRLPSKIDFTGMEVSKELKDDIEKNFCILLEQAQEMRKALNLEYYKAIKEVKLDFSEPLRFYLIANNNTKVMQNISKAIAQAISNEGYHAELDMQYGIEDEECLKNILLTKPHATVNINAMRRFCIGDDVFNFVWFQDPMPFLLDTTEVTIHKRDFVFSLLPMLDRLLEKKNIPYQRQGFCVNEVVYKWNSNIKREKKIVFIGSSYLKYIPYTQATKSAVKELEAMFIAGENFTLDVVQNIAERYKLDFHFVQNRLIPYVVRDIGLLELCKIKSEYKIEIYGWGWEVYEELQPYYKGVLQYGQEIADVYSSATFAFAPHQLYTLQQRVFEASACGAIPIVYDCRDTSDEISYDEALCYYKTTQDLENILKSDIPQKNFTKLLENNTYNSFVRRIVGIIEGNK